MQNLLYSGLVASIPYLFVLEHLDVLQLLHLGSRSQNLVMSVVTTNGMREAIQVQLWGSLVLVLVVAFSRPWLADLISVTLAQEGVRSLIRLHPHQARGSRGCFVESALSSGMLMCPIE